MDPAEVLLALLTAFVAADIGSSHVKLARLERELANKPDRSEWLTFREELANKPDRSEWLLLREDLSNKPDRTELQAIQETLAAMPSREEFNALREDVVGIRTEATATRGDLTQIALAVGAGRPRKVE